MNPRDEMILARWMAGEKAPALARELRLHRGRVAAIIQNAAYARRLLAPNDIRTLPLSTRAMNGLLRMEINTIEEFLALKPSRLGREPNCGKVTVAEVAALQEKILASS